MVLLVSDKSVAESSNASETVPAQDSIVSNGTNGVINGESHGVTDEHSENGASNNANGQPGEWESFEVHYVGRGLSTFQATNGEDSDSSFVSDSDDDQYKGYEPITLQTLQTHTSDSECTNSEEDVIDGALPENGNTEGESSIATPRVEHRPLAATLTASQQNGTAAVRENESTACSNDIPLDEKRIAEITAAMSGFVLPPLPSIPDDAKLLEMVKRITQS